MDNVIVEYSQFFNDDGGFEKVKSDFKNLGNELIKEAQKIKSEVNSVFDLSNAGDVKKYEDLAEQLTDNYKSLQKAKEDLGKAEKVYNQNQQKSLKITQLQNKNLAQLELTLSKYKNELKENNTLEKIGAKNAKDSAETRAKLKIKIKQVTQEINKQQKEIIDSNKLSKQQEKLLKAEITLQKGRATTLAEVRERLSALRLVASQVNIETEEGKELLAEYNDEINQLTDVLDENSDKFIQSKINVGNYEESIVSALNNSDLFKTNIGALDGTLQSLLGVLTLNKEQLEEMEKKLGSNANAVQRFAIRFGKLNKVLKASIIGIVLLALASLSSLFGDTRAGAVRLEQATETLRRGFVALTQSAKEIFKSFFGLFDGIGDKVNLVALKVKKFFLESTNAFGRNKEAIKEVSTEIETLTKRQEENNQKTKENGTLAERLKSIWNNTSKSIVKGLKNIEKAYELEDDIRKLNLELSKTTNELERQQLIADDSTRSFKEQLTANKRSLSLIEDVGKKNLEIAQKELELANEKLKANALQRAEENKGLNLSLTGAAFAEKTLQFAKDKGSALEISNQLLKDQQDALLRLREVEGENLIKVEENAKKRREIDRDLFEQNLDLLIDLIDTEKNLSEQQVNNTAKNFKDRVSEFSRFTAKFKDNAQKELDEFTKFAKKTGKDLNFDIKFNNDGGFDILRNGVKFTIDNVVELNKELQALGLAEIPINRFREFVVETRNGVKDINDLNKSLTETQIKVNELADDLVIDEQELARLEKLEERIAELNSIEDFNKLSQSQRKGIVDELKDLERQKTEIVDEAERERQLIRIKAIDEQLKNVEKGSEDYYNLLRERRAIEKQISEKNAADIKKEVDEANKKAIERYEKFQKEVRRILNLVANKFVETAQKQVSEQEKSISKQEKRLDEQRERANLGLDNTLKFEQEKKAEQEAELIKRNKRLERLEKIKSVYSSYSNYANAGEKNPLAKALRDFGILEAITASFSDGGIVGLDGYSNVRTNEKGVTLGQSHNVRGGVLAYHEGGEGFLSRREMANLGEDNFRAIKRRAGLGIVDKNFFSDQNNDFIQVISRETEPDYNLVNEVREVKKAIKNKPEQSLDVEGLVDGFLKLTETEKRGNKIKRNHFKIKKRRL